MATSADGSHSGSKAAVYPTLGLHISPHSPTVWDETPRWDLLSPAQNFAILLVAGEQVVLAASLAPCEGNTGGEVAVAAATLGSPAMAPIRVEAVLPMPAREYYSERDSPAFRSLLSRVRSIVPETHTLRQIARLSLCRQRGHRRRIWQLLPAVFA